MKLPRQFFQISGTGILLAALLLALKLTAPSDAVSVQREAGIRKEAGLSSPGFSRVAEGETHAEVLGDRSDLPADTAVVSRYEPDRLRMATGQIQAVEASHAKDGDMISPDPIIAAFKELQTTMRDRVIDHETAGHSLSAFGRRVSVDDSRQVSGTTGVMLSLTVETIPSPSNINNIPSSSHPETQAIAQAVADPATEADSQNTTRWQGLSYEQELFRTKWGWHAYDQVQKVLRESHSQ